ncbi:MAG: F0F1 ATP synthase subunit B [Armatimonadota bacterium]|nr:F0F1 ATP synthase subunit B [Armatimonadota bacterium]MCX7776561.1 F0F1 ATP synthase subunit B [Armatimonadota bacterium]MDW8026105.1 F0F1 ATP synthase subunit B [Armatimonadota bacterium]
MEQFNPLNVLSEMHLNWGYILTQVGSFLILLFLMAKFLFKPLQSLLEERRERIRKAIEDAERERREAEKLRKEYEQYLVRIEDEARKKIQEAMREAYAARDELLSQARADAQRMLERVRRELEYEREKMLIELRDFITDMSVAIAGKALGKILDMKAHRQLIAQILEEELPLENASGNGGRNS